MKSNTFNNSYIGPRNDVLRLIPDSSKNVLDVGCSTGILGVSIKEKTGAKVTGIEVSSEMAKVAAKGLDNVIVGSIEDHSVLAKVSKTKFDTIILADVLEHLVDPWSVLKSLTNFLTTDGVVVISLPNIRHFNTFYNLFFKGIWPYRDRGIHDKTHLHQFTKKNIETLLTDSGLKLEKLDANYRIVEQNPHALNAHAKLIALPGIREFIAYQYLVVAKKIQ